MTTRRSENALEQLIATKRKAEERYHRVLEIEDALVTLAALEKRFAIRITASQRSREEPKGK